jgi:hypothetical protein
MNLTPIWPQQLLPCDAANLPREHRQVENLARLSEEIMLSRLRNRNEKYERRGRAQAQPTVVAEVWYDYRHRSGEYFHMQSYGLL